MSTNRRRFLETAAANAAALAIMPAAAFGATHRDSSSSITLESPEWDLNWTDRVKGKHRAVFDCTEPESGSGPWRAKVWTTQNIEVLKASPSDVTPIIVLRHNAIILAMQQTFWDKYGIGAKKKITDPMTEKPTDRNPAAASLSSQISSGAIVLACALALDECVGLIADTEKLSHSDAEKRALAYLIPGIILQPSGVFAVIRAQEAGALYVIAS